MGIFRSKEKKHQTSETTSKDVAMSLEDAKLQEDLEEMVEEQKEEAEKEAIKKRLDDAELQHLAEQAEAELTDTSEAHLYLRIAQELIDEKKIESSYQEVIKIAIAYIRIGEVNEALKLIDSLDLPTEQYTQTLAWEKEVKNLNPFSYHGTKLKKQKTELLRWRFKDSREDAYSHRYHSHHFSEAQVVDDALRSTQSLHEAELKRQLGFNVRKNFIELQGMSPREFVMAMLAYYSNWMGGVSTPENVKKFASTLKDPSTDFGVELSDPTTRLSLSDYKKQFEEQYRALQERYQKKRTISNKKSYC